MSKKSDLSPEEQLALARATIDKLETQRQGALERRSEVLTETREVAYHSLGVGDAQAKEKLTKLESENATLARQVDLLDTAIAVAREKLQDAEAAVNRQAAKAKAFRIRALAHNLRRFGADVDDAANELARKFAQIENTLQELRRIGVDHPSGDLVRVNTIRSLMAALRELPLKLDVIPPGERIPFGELTNSWAKSAERAADVLANSVPAKAAA